MTSDKQCGPLRGLTHVWEGWQWQSACPAAIGKGVTK